MKTIISDVVEKYKKKYIQAVLRFLKENNYYGNNDSEHMKYLNIFLKSKEIVEVYLPTLIFSNIHVRKDELPFREMICPILIDYYLELLTILEENKIIIRKNKNKSIEEIVLFSVNEGYINIMFRTNFNINTIYHSRDMYFIEKLIRFRMPNFIVY